jgi:NAD(P)-dependent dehydrogenase (short-subunit alcohol dehydrogenase family)
MTVNILITGASRGIGAAIVDRLSGEDTAVCRASAADPRPPSSQSAPPVTSNEARQSRLFAAPSGLPRRYAPRNDGAHYWFDTLAQNGISQNGSSYVR